MWDEGNPLAPILLRNHSGFTDVTLRLRGGGVGWGGGVVTGSVTACKQPAYNDIFDMQMKTQTTEQTDKTNFK